jgi:3-dehydroquinate synthase
VIVSRRIESSFLPQIASSLEEAGIEWLRLPVDDGDENKDLAQVARVVDRMAEAGVVRDATVVAVGGGVVGDLAGFIAATYMRGIGLVHVPTTLVSQVDSSIGGKVGVNHRSSKNLVGTFYPARLVLADPCTLRTLPERELACGMAEVIKTALVGSQRLFRFLEEELSRGGRGKIREIDFLAECVRRCIEVKGRIVEGDPFDRGLRHLLNLGHTAGHAIEAAAGYRGVSHGEAVALGLLAALRIAEARGMAGEALSDRTRRLLETCGLPTRLPPVDREALLRALRLDKKRRNGRMRFVLPMRPGRAKLVDDVDDEEILSALERPKA